MNNINWVGNRVFEQDAANRSPQTANPPQSAHAAGNERAYTAPEREEAAKIVSNERAYTAPAREEAAKIVPNERAYTAPVMEESSQRSPEEAILRSEQGPPPVFDRYYIPGYLSDNIGKMVRAEFVIGTNQYIDKSGIIREVGVNYFVLRDTFFNVDVMCDLYSVKFVTLV